MPPQPSAVQLIIEMLQSLGLHALHEEQNTQLGSQQRDPNFDKLGHNKLTEPELIQLPLTGLGILKGRCIRLPAKQVANVSWAGLLWVTENGKGDHRLQIVMAGNGRPFGYRWEPPEGANAPDHNYWHAQPITAVRITSKTDIALGLDGANICTHVPTFPVDAPDNLSLLDALFVSIYGPSYLATYVTEAWIRAFVHKWTLKRSWSSIRITQSKAATTVGITKSIMKISKKKKR